MGLLFYKWSRTSASNAGADSSVGWSEGQAPSTINDSARAMMASLAGYRDDNAGAITTGGTSTAYTVATYQVFDNLANLSGQTVSFTVHATNGASPTLNVDGLGARNIGIDPNTAVPAGTLIAGSPYTAIYSSSLGIFLLKDFYQLPLMVPIGAAVPYFGSTAPNSNFVFPYGQQISQSTYSTLYGIFGSNRYGADGGGLFYLPDLRGRVVAGKDNMGGSAASRLSGLTMSPNGITLGASGGAQLHTLQTTEIPSHTHVNTLNDPGHVHTIPALNALSGGVATNNAANVGTQSTGSATTGVTITNAAAGGGGAHNNMQPTFVGNYILRII